MEPRHAAHLKVLFDMLDSTEHLQTDDEGRHPILLRYVREVQRMMAVTGMDKIPLDVHTSVCLDYHPVFAHKSTYYTFGLTVMVSGMDFGYVQDVQLYDDHILIRSDVDYIYRFPGCDMASMVKESILLELDLDHVPSRNSPAYLLYSRALPNGTHRRHRSRSAFDRRTVYEKYTSIGKTIKRVYDHGNGVPDAEPLDDDSIYTFNGVTKTLGQWRKEAMMPKDLLAERVARGMSLEHALCAPRDVPARKKGSKRPNRRKKKVRGYVMHAPLYFYKGEYHTIDEWGDKLDIPPDELRRRMGEGNMPLWRAIKEYRYEHDPYWRDDGGKDIYGDNI